MSNIRASSPNPIKDLGVLGDLPGRWVGTGFNLIARPDFGAVPAFFLELNTTMEELVFTNIGSPIFNRGSLMPDAEFFGVHYLQQVTDITSKDHIHLEPGLWINLTAPGAAASTVIRQATIPHGDSLLAQSSFASDSPTGQPIIDPVLSLPFTGPATGPGSAGLTGPQPGQFLITNPYVAQYANGVVNNQGVFPPLPAGKTFSDVILDPNILLTAAIAGQTITKTVVLAISTEAVPTSTGILNIPFVQRNANAARMDAIFWIETIGHVGGKETLQLQYVQRVILDFPDGPTPGNPIIHWPHISVATLTKQ